MSFYATLQGEIKYPNKELFDAILEELTDEGWLVDDFFIDECEEFYNSSDTPDIDRENLVITIPLGHYRNMSRVEFFNGPGVEGNILGSSTDGCFEAWEIVDGEETSIDLNEWAKEEVEEKPPLESECSSEEDYWENMTAWQNMVEELFHSEGF